MYVSLSASRARAVCARSARARFPGTRYPIRPREPPPAVFAPSERVPAPVTRGHFCRSQSTGGIVRRRQDSPSALKLPSSLCIARCASADKLRRFQSHQAYSGQASAGQMWWTVVASTTRPYRAASRHRYLSRRSIRGRTKRRHLRLSYPSHMSASEKQKRPRRSPEVISVNRHRHLGTGTRHMQFSRLSAACTSGTRPAGLRRLSPAQRLGPSSCRSKGRPLCLSALPVYLARDGVSSYFVYLVPISHSSRLKIYTTPRQKNKGSIQFAAGSAPVPASARAAGTIYMYSSRIHSGAHPGQGSPHRAEPL